MLAFALQDSLDWLGDADVANMLRQHYRAAAQEGSTADDAGEEEREVLARQLQLSLNDLIEDRMDRLRGTADVRSSLKLRDYAYARRLPASISQRNSSCVVCRACRAKECDGARSRRSGLHVAGGASGARQRDARWRRRAARPREAHLHRRPLRPARHGLLSRVLSSPISPTRHALTAHTARDRLSRFGFGRGKAKAKPRPSDNKTIVIFVIGGITCAEIQEALQQVADSVGGEEEGDADQYQVLIGSTSLSTSSGVLSHLFAAEQQ